MTTPYCFPQFDEKLYDAGDRSKVFSAEELSTGKRVIVKMRRKGFFSGGERVWRSVLTRIMNIEQNDNVLGIDTIMEDEKVGGFFACAKFFGGGKKCWWRTTEGGILDHVLGCIDTLLWRSRSVELWNSG